MRDCFIVKSGFFYTFYMVYDDVDFTLKDYLSNNIELTSVGGEVEMMFIANSLAIAL